MSTISNSLEGPDCRLRVLVVGNDRVRLEIIVRHLRCSGYAARRTSGRAAALDVAAAFEPEVLLLDIDANETEGVETATQLREVPRLKGSTFIAQCDRASCDIDWTTFDYALSKSCPLQELEQVMRWATHLQWQRSYG